MKKVTKKLFEKADFYTKKGNYQKAVACYELVLLDEKDKFVRELAYWGAGECYLDLGLFEEAEEYLRKAVGLNPLEPNYHYLLGIAFSKRERFTEAILEFEEALKLAPDHPEILRGLGWATFMDGKLDQGRLLLERSLELDRENVLTLCDLAVVLMRGFQYQKARSLLQKAQEVEPNNPMVEETIAACEFFRREFEKARRLEKFKKELEGLLGKPGVITTIKPYWDEKAVSDYMKAHQLLPKNYQQIPVGEIRREGKKLFLKKTSLADKKRIIILLAHHGSQEALSLLKRFRDKVAKNRAMKTWGEMAIEECLTFLEKKDG